MSNERVELTAPEQSLRRRQLLPYLLIPYLFLVVLKLALSWGLDSPLKPDELVYLGTARYLATGEGLTDDTGRHAYKVGYSIALAPAFFFADDSVGGFKAAQVINAFLLSLVYPAAFLLVGRLRQGLLPLDRLLLALAVSVYPAALLYSTTAMSANLFMPSYFLYLLVGCEALARPRWWNWAGFGAATILLYAVHERALGIVLVACALAVLHLLWGAAPRIRSLAFFAALPVSLGLLRLAEVPGSRWHTRSQSLSVLEGALKNPQKMLVTLVGHVEYLGFSTFATLFVGTLFLLFTVRRVTPWKAPRLFWLLLYGSAGSVFAISVLFNVVRWPEPRFTQWIYGRHNEMVLLPMVLVALLALRHASEIRHRKMFLLSCVSSVTLLVLLAGILRWFWRPIIGPAYSFCATSIAFYSQMLHFGGLMFSALALAAGFLALMGLFAVRWRWGMVGLSLCFLTSSLVTYTDGWRHRYEERDEQRELVHLVHRMEQEVGVPKDRVILHDRRRGKVFHFHYFNNSYFLPDYTFKAYRAKDRRPGGELVLSAHLDLARERPGARLVGLENFSWRNTRYLQALWVLPGPLQDALAERGWLVPEEFPSPLPPEYLRSELRLAEAAVVPEVLTRGHAAFLPLKIVHKGAGPWPHHGGMRGIDHSVRIAVSWIPEDATTRAMQPVEVQPVEGQPVEVQPVEVQPVEVQPVEVQHWTDLPRMLYPGEEAETILRLRADPSLEPGTYRVVVALAQEADRQPVVVAEESLEWTIQVRQDPH